MKVRNYRSVAVGVSVAALLSMSSQAMAGGYDKSWYAGLGAGWAWADDLAYTTSDADEAPAIYGKIGKPVFNNNWRAELDLSYRDHDVGGGAPATSVNGDATVTALMVNLIRDLNVELPAGITPYIGAGIGGAQVAADGTGPVYTVDEEEIVAAGQLLAGLNVPVTETVFLDLGYKYFDTLGADVSNGVASPEESFGAHSANIGLRWVFGAAEEPAPVAPPPPPVEEPKEALFKIYFPFDESRLTAEAQETVSRDRFSVQRRTSGQDRRTRQHRYIRF